MLEKVVELVKKHPKISDFHLRSECAFSYRLLGEIKSAAEFALNSNYPQDNELYTDVYI